jgi:hypothetical protein
MISDRSTRCTRCRLRRFPGTLYLYWQHHLSLFFSR